MERIISTSYEIGVYNPKQNVSDDCKVVRTYPNGCFEYSAYEENGFLTFSTIEQADEQISKMRSWLEEDEYMNRLDWVMFIVAKNIIEVKVTKVDRVTLDEISLATY